MFVTKIFLLRFFNIAEKVRAWSRCQQKGRFSLMFGFPSFLMLIDDEQMGARRWKLTKLHICSEVQETSCTNMFLRCPHDWG